MQSFGRAMMEGRENVAKIPATVILKQIPV
jgi:hypothetical protein